MKTKKSTCTCGQDRRFTADLASLQKFRFWGTVVSSAVMLVLVVANFTFNTITGWFLIAVTFGWLLIAACLTIYRLARGHDTGCAVRWALVKTF